MPLNLFWTALILLDAAVVILLLLGHRRSGLVLALAIMVLDMAANSYVLFGLNIPFFAVPIQLQTAFLGFVLGSIAFLWPKPERSS